jgi:protocatechuate 3,4-dioxygenase beta subunit
MAGAAVYLWHCDIEGRYSMYDVAGENYLRGVQETDDDGKVTFTSIFPAAYAGRWPHIHFEVYESLDAATSAGAKLKTSQIALPQDACELVYGTEGYEQSAEMLAQTSLDTDNVFSDGYASQLATTSGTVDDRITIALNVGV